jgi:hypothetical protein
LNDHGATALEADVTSGDEGPKVANSPPDGIDPGEDDLAMDRTVLVVELRGLFVRS